MSLRIGVLVDSPFVSKYVHDIVTWANAHEAIDLDCLIVPGRDDSAGSTHDEGVLSAVRRQLVAGQWRAVVARIAFRALTSVESLLLRRSPRYALHGARFDIRGLASHTIETRPLLSPSGLVSRLPADDLERIRARGLDVLLRFGEKILRGEILAASRLGIVSFHHGDNRVNRGGPPGFWEVYHRSDYTGFILQRLTEELDGGDVLVRGSFPTAWYCLQNQAALFEKSNHHLKRLLAQVARTGELPEPLPHWPYSHPLLRRPNATQAMRYAAGLGQVVLRKTWRRLRGRGERWHVAYLRGDWRRASLWRGKEIANPPHRFLADPFVITREGRSYCFVEDLDYRTGRGSIAVHELGDEGATDLGYVLQESFHLSFPFLFEYDGQLFMCPETGANRDIRVYRCVEFPLRWELASVLMNDIDAVDTMLFARDGRWWMLTNIDATGLGEFSAELSVFWSTDPLSQQWTPHPLNPVITDADRARNAGLLIDADRLFRVSQRQGYDIYGKGARISEIVSLSESDYVEEAVVTIEPRFRDGIHGTHHMHSDGHYTVFDFVKLDEKLD